jgi:hypothetical protein
MLKVLQACQAWISYHDFSEHQIDFCCVQIREVYPMSMHRDEDRRGGFRIPKVKLEESKKPLADKAGLQALLRIFDSTDLGEELAKCLPEDGSNRAVGNYRLGLLLIASLLSGHDSLDDLEEFKDDDLAESLFDGKVPTPKTMGNFLRKFSDQNIKDLKHFITKLGYTLREHTLKVHSHKGEAIPHFKIDGTVHEQHGSQMEGCGWMKISVFKAAVVFFKNMLY